MMRRRSRGGGSCGRGLGGWWLGCGRLGCGRLGCWCLGCWCLGCWCLRCWCLGCWWLVCWYFGFGRHRVIHDRLKISWFDAWLMMMMTMFAVFPDVGAVFGPILHTPSPRTTAPGVRSLRFFALSPIAVAMMSCVTESWTATVMVMSMKLFDGGAIQQRGCI